MSRKLNNVYIRKDGRLEKRFMFNGKRYSVYAFTSKELLTKEQEMITKLREGVYKTSRLITLDQWFEEWIEEKRKEVKGSSVRVYKNQYYKHISPIIGKVKVQKLEKRQVKEMLDKLPDSLSDETYNCVLRVIKLVLHDAVRDEIIMRNPSDGIRGRKRTKKASETYHRALTESEQKIFMQEIKNDFYYEYIALLLCTGMRLGEVAALEWSDIDYENNVIKINKTMTTDENGKTVVGDSPKSESGKREIPLTEAIKAILKSQKHKMKMLNGTNIISFTNRIFSTQVGNMASNEVINRAIAEALKRLDEKGTHVDHFTAHALRDTFATRFIEQGGTPQTLKTILGHSSLAMTMDLYSHVLPNTKQKEMDRIQILV